MKRKLTDRQVQLIKADRVSVYRVLADKFEVSPQLITAIKSGRPLKVSSKLTEKEKAGYV